MLVLLRRDRRTRAFLLMFLRTTFLLKLRFTFLIRTRFLLHDDESTLSLRSTEHEFLPMRNLRSCSICGSPSANLSVSRNPRSPEVPEITTSYLRRSLSRRIGAGCFIETLFLVGFLNHADSTADGFVFIGPLLARHLRRQLEISRPT